MLKQLVIGLTLTVISANALAVVEGTVAKDPKGDWYCKGSTGDAMPGGWSTTAPISEGKSCQSTARSVISPTQTNLDVEGQPIGGIAVKGAAAEKTIINTTKSNTKDRLQPVSSGKGINQAGIK